MSWLRHSHTLEDEFVFLLAGELVLRTVEGEQLLSAGTCAGFVAGARNGHQLINRSAAPARYLELSNRDPADRADYWEDDLAYGWTADGEAIFTRKDGTPY